MDNAQNYAKGFSLAIIGVLVLSPDALLIRLVHADGWTISMYRTGFMAITLFTASLFMGRKQVMDLWRGLDRKGVLAAGLYCVATIMFIGSITRTMAANTLVIVAAMPLMAAVFSRLFLGERQHLATWIAVTAVMVGVAVIFMGSLGTGYLLGDVMALVSACALGANFTALRRSTLKNPLPTRIIAGALASALMFPLADPTAITSHDLMYLLIGGAIVQPLAFFLILSAPKYIPSPDVALVMLMETFAGPLLVWLFLGERPMVQVVVAGVLIVAAVGTHATLALRRSKINTSAAYQHS